MDHVAIKELSRLARHVHVYPQTRCSEVCGGDPGAIVTQVRG